MKKILSVLLAFVLVFALCACGSAKAKEAAYEPQAAPAVMLDGAAGGFAAANYKAEAMAEEAVAYETDMSASASGSDVPSDNPEKIIYSADATLESTSFDEAVKSVLALIDEYKAYVESSSMNGSNYSSISSGNAGSRSAEYVIRVPAESFEKLMSSLSTIGNVPYSHVYTENVSSQYYDTEARLRTYRAQEDRLLELLDKAETVSDVIEIENELTEVRYRIESLQTTLNGWDRQVSYSTVYLSLREVKEYTPENRIGFGRQMVNALAQGLELLKDFVLGLATALPLLIIVAAVVFGIIKLIKKLRKKKNA